MKKNYEALMEHICDGREWEELTEEERHECMAQYLEDEGHCTLFAALDQAQYDSVFTILLADLLTKRYLNPEDFAAAGRKFAAAAYALAKQEAESACAWAYEFVLDDWKLDNQGPDVDAAMDNYLRWQDFKEMSK